MEQKQPADAFPCQRLPEEAAACRLIGLYPQRQEGLWLQRVRVDGGRLTGKQWQALAKIVRRFGPNEPLHLTTRQDVEIHGLAAADVPQVQKMLAEVGLTGRGACGDTIRNITVCPCSGLVANTPDLLPLARQLTQILQSQPGAFALPRKLKISFSACRKGCGQPWINDLGFVAVPSGVGWKFQVIFAGSLGAKPATGIEYGKTLDAGEVPSFTLAVFRVFAAHGDRQQRSKARLRHVRQRVGDAVFLELIERELETVRKEQAWPDIPLTSPADGLASKRTLRLEDGNMSAAVAEAIGSLADREDMRMRIGNQHAITVFARDDSTIESALVQTRLNNFAGSAPQVVVCPGTRWCSRALADTTQLAAAVRQKLDGANVGNVLIAISGCPNGCAHSTVADVGATGLTTSVQGDKIDAWNIFSGGQRGVGPELAKQTDEKLPTETAAAKIVVLAAACRADK